MIAFLRCRNQIPRQARGASLVELVIGSMILIFAFAMAAAIAGVNGRNLLTSRTTSNQDALIDSDISAIRRLSEEYTWCTGAGTLAASGPSCDSTSARNQNYYFPSNSTNIALFESACADTTAPDDLNVALVNQINSRATLPGITRSVTYDNVPAHRLRITYTGTNVNRVILLTPTVAGWCP